MSEHIHEQISAFLDDELSAEESAFLVRRLASDSLAHKQTVRYAAIGSVLREESVLANSRLLRGRIQAVLDGTSAAQAPVRTQAQRPARWAKVAASISVAASVAIAALFGLRTAIETDESSVTAADVAPGVWNEPNSYVVPVDATSPAPVITATPPIELTNLIMQHGQFTSHVNRASVNSSVIGRTESEPAEQTEPETESP